MRYGSVCSGIEAATVAWRHLGWECAFVSEIDAFASAVLKERLPAVPNLGDFTKIRPGDYGGDIDLLVGGTPCQAFSKAGLRKGLEDERGNLALEFAGLAFRTHPRWVVWENVPGVLSSGGGRDFAIFLSMLAGWEIPVPKGGWKKAGILTAAPGCFSVVGECLTLNIPEFNNFRGRSRSEGSVLSLRDILETGELSKECSLTGKCAEGILRRAAMRGDRLPKGLAAALANASRST